MTITQAIKKLRKSWNAYQPLIEVRIFRDNIIHNLKACQTAYPKFLFAPVLKSNAYGHGLAEVAEILDDQRLPFFMADSLFEARSLRHAGIKTAILVLGFTTAENIGQNKLKNVAFGITGLEQLRKLDVALKRQTSLHLKIDTGMRRQGIMPEELDEALGIIKKNKLMLLEGVCSHLADADGEGAKFTNGQISLWNKLIAETEKQFGAIKFKHLANTAGAHFGKSCMTWGIKKNYTSMRSFNFICP